MYTFELLVYGHKISEEFELSLKSLSLNKFIVDNDFEFSWANGDIEYECSFPYHGGITTGEHSPIIFGHKIPINLDIVQEARAAKEEAYKDGYKIFLEKYTQNLKEYREEFEGNDLEKFELMLEGFIKFTSKPAYFYSIQASS